MPISLVRPLTSMTTAGVDAAGAVPLSDEGVSAGGMVRLQSCVFEPIETDGWSLHVELPQEVVHGGRKWVRGAALDHDHGVGWREDIRTIPGLGRAAGAGLHVRCAQMRASDQRSPGNHGQQARYQSLGDSVLLVGRQRETLSLIHI